MDGIRTHISRSGAGRASVPNCGRPQLGTAGADPEQLWSTTVAQDSGIWAYVPDPAPLGRFLRRRWALGLIGKTRPRTRIGSVISFARRAVAAAVVASLVL